MRVSHSPFVCRRYENGQNHVVLRVPIQIDGPLQNGQDGNDKRRRAEQDLLGAIQGTVDSEGWFEPNRFLTIPLSSI